MDDLEWYWDGGVRICSDCEAEVAEDDLECIFYCTECGREADE